MSVSLPELLRRISQGPYPMAVQGVLAPAEAKCLAELKEKHPNQTLVRLTLDAKSAFQLKEDINFFLPKPLQKSLALFPAHDTLPYTGIVPQGDVTAERLSILHRLVQKEPLLLIVSPPAWLRKLPPPSFFTHYTRTFSFSETFDREEMARYLVETGYRHMPLVEEPGQFALRGGVVDIFSPTTEYPVRMELEGDRIASMRFFDPASQRSKEICECLTLTPARETVFTPSTQKTAIRQLKKFADALELPATFRRQVQEYLEKGIYFTGIETFLPVFFEKLSPLSDYLPPETWTFSPEPEELRKAEHVILEEIQNLYRAAESHEKIISPELLWAALDTPPTHVFLNPLLPLSPNDLRVEIQPVLGFKTLWQKKHTQSEDIFHPIADQLKTWLSQNRKITVVTHTEIQKERLQDLFKWHGLSYVPIVTGKLSGGFFWPVENEMWLTEQEIFGQKTVRRLGKIKNALPVSNFSDLSSGDLLVHEEHGIGRYAGLQHMTIASLEGDYLLLEYLGGDKLYLPIYRLNTVQKYIGGGETSGFLDRLGGTRWKRAKKKAGEAVYKIAQELLRIHAQRELYPGFAYPPADLLDEEFAAGFPYDETPDQAQAIEEVLKDMSRDKPMDRLICGDVGYGKTEVAMRAAFKAASAGKQVCVLVPTTVLALQHAESFQNRFASLPVRIEMLSRFKTPSEQKVLLAEIAKGRVDVVIGTHRLLMRDVHFRNLGLLVIDEEQRFGVRHKEKIKKLKSTVDVLTLTATPIPRTLHMSLIGLKDLSLIHTPPADRRSIQTYIAKPDDAVIRHGILKELDRDGQVFFVHNRVQTIEAMKRRLEKLIPESPIAVAHGQMEEEVLEQVMMDFLHRKSHILLCTAIIESGLDVPNANTMIVNRADHFGLAQLYQLRGRVGRSDRQAYCYLLMPEEEGITLEAKRRLEVLTRHTDLGGGFQIASQDLEIRGSGNLLGSSQSGFIEEIGYELYTQLLSRTLRKLKGEKVLDEIHPEIQLKISAFIPSRYVAESQIRMDLYKRLSHTSSEEDIAELEKEWTDRFGPLPPEVQKLFWIVDIKNRAQKLRLKAIRYDQGKLVLELDTTTPLSPQALVSLVTQSPNEWSLKPPDKLVAFLPGIREPDQIVAEAKKRLSLLLNCVS